MQQTFFMNGQSKHVKLVITVAAAPHPSYVDGEDIHV